MRRMVLLGLLCFVLLLTVTGCTEPQQGVEGNLRWSLDRWGTITIEGEGTIPDYFRAAFDTEMGLGAVLSQATHLVIGEGITEIGYSAFFGMPRLKTVELPDSITEIGRYAFSSCDSLIELRIPAGVTQISDIISDSVKVRRLYLPAGVENIESGLACPALEEFIVDEGNPYLISRDGVIFSADGTVLLAYPAGKKDKVYTVPEGVAKIGWCAFAYAQKLTEVILPEGVRTICRGGFSDGENLRAVHLPRTLETIEAYAFEGCPSLEDIRLPDSLTSVGEGAFLFCDSLQEINLPSQLTEIADNLFQNCGSLTSVTLPEALSRIGRAAFWDCDALTTVHLPAAVQTIDWGAFTSCYQLSSFTVDPGNPIYTAIGGVLCSADGKTLVSYPLGRGDVVYRVPEGIVHIAPYAFYYADELETVILADSVSTMGEHVFAYCKKLTAITLPSQMIAVPERAFIGCSSLRILTLPAGLQKIGEGAFIDAESMAQIRFGGTELQWASVEIDTNNDALQQAEVIFGAEQEP